jgi:hypothetical protein
VLVGFLVACVTTSAVDAVAVGVADAAVGGLENVGGNPRNDPSGFILLCGLLAANIGGWTGGVLGAFLPTPDRQGGTTSGVRKGAALASILGLV